MRTQSLRNLPGGIIFERESGEFCGLSRLLFRIFVMASAPTTPS